jgi:hAT family C-terminal dimerisation region
VGDPTHLKKFKLLAEDTHRQLSSSAVTSSTVSDVQSELDRSEAEIPTIQCDSALEFWTSRTTVYPNLGLLAQDLVAAPASQTCVERVFSLCGDLCARNNRMTVGLERRVFLKMNCSLLSL